MKNNKRQRSERHDHVLARPAIQHLLLISLRRSNAPPVLQPAWHSSARRRTVSVMGEFELNWSSAGCQKGADDPEPQGRMEVQSWPQRERDRGLFRAIRRVSGYRGRISGTYSASLITLKGAAPRRSKDSCTVAEAAKSYPHAVLKFKAPPD